MIGLCYDEDDVGGAVFVFHLESGWRNYICSYLLLLLYTFSIYTLEMTLDFFFIILFKVFAHFYLGHATRHSSVSLIIFASSWH